VKKIRFCAKRGRGFSSVKNSNFQQVTHIFLFLQEKKKERSKERKKEMRASASVRSTRNFARVRAYFKNINQDLYKNISRLVFIRLDYI